MFDIFRRDFPDKAAGTVPIGGGTFGMVLAAPDEAAMEARKVLYRFDWDDVQQRAEHSAAQEIQALRLFGGVCFGRARTPRLLSEFEALDHDAFFGTYCMTRLPGNSVVWNRSELFEEKGALTYAKHFYQAGEVLARFHDYGRHLHVEPEALPRMEWCERIRALPEFSEEVRRTLNAVDRYYQAHKKPVIAYKDFHGGNLMVDGDGDICGVVDFSDFCFCDNHYADFAHVPMRCMPHFIKGYEAASGEAVDPVMMRMTVICACIDSFQFCDGDPEARAKALSEMHENLRALPDFVFE